MDFLLLFSTISTLVNCVECDGKITFQLCKKERCVGGFTQNNNESLNQLIWKISPKIVNGSSNIVKIAANVAACTLNEGCFALLAFMLEMDIKTGTTSHEWARTVDSIRINRAEQEAAKECKEGRIRRRQEQKDALDIVAESPTLYGAGIDDSV